MVTKQEALVENYFHSSVWKNKDESCQRWRRNGKTKIWKTRPNDFRMPIKYGIRDFSYIIYVEGDEVLSNNNEFHLARTCTGEENVSKTNG